MKRTGFIIAVVASSVAALSTAPVYAGGVRVNFGGPLGSFVATPYAKGSAGNYSGHTKSYKNSSASNARAIAAKKTAARKAEKRRLLAKKAAAAKLAAAEAKANKLAKLRLEEQKAAEKKAETQVAKAAPVKASTIAGTDTLKLKSDRTGLSDLPEPKNAQRVNDAEVLEAKQSNEEVSVKDAGADEDFDDKSELTCKKYIPSAGLTITVPCGP
jgi:hypothetical protein